MADINFQNIVLHFKTEKCKANHLPSKNDICPYYHDDSDFRRNPISPDGKYIMYHNIYFLPNLVSEIYRFDYCYNLFEYYYHPLNYKTKSCPYLNVNQVCNRGEFCPYLHHNECLYSLKVLYNQFLGCQILPDINLQRLSLAEDHPMIFSKREQYIYTLPNGEQAYIFNTQIDLQEDNNHEFKAWAVTRRFDWIVDTLEEYICAFANSNGGTIYIGISDDGYITGTICNREISDGLRVIIGNMVTFHKK